MIYKVLNDNNVVVNVNDNDIEMGIKNGLPLKREIVQAMGKSHNEKYLQNLYPVLNHEQFYMRVDAAQSIFNLSGSIGLEALKKRESELEIADLECEPSEKAILTAMIVRIEKGIDGVKKIFLSEDGSDAVKYDSLYYYHSGYNFKEEDIELIYFILKNFIDKKMNWIKKLQKAEYNDFIYFALESIWVAGEETDILKIIDDELSQNICELLYELIKQKVNNDTKEIIAEISKYVKKNYAKEILRMLKNNVKGDAKKVYKNSLKQWEIAEEDL